MTGLMAAIFQSLSLADGTLAGLSLRFISQRLQFKQRAKKASTSVVPNFFFFPFVRSTPKALSD